MTPGSELTVLLTLKDRGAFTMRWMAYAEATRLPFRVLIADGGTDESVRAALSSPARFPSVRFEYLRFPPDRDYARYYEKIVQALECVRTRYVVMADNDDFLVARTLLACVEFLETHPGYAACGGQQAVFWLGARAVAESGGVRGDDLQWKCGHDASIEAERAVPRMMAQAHSLSESFYDVKRTSTALEHFRAVRDAGLNDIFLMVNLVDFLCAISGKIRRLDHVHLARQFDAPGSSAGEHQHRNGDWMGRMLQDTWSADFARFSGAVARSLAGAEGIPESAAREEVVRAYRMAVAPALLSDLLDEPTVPFLMPAKLSVLRRMVRMHPRSALRGLLRKAYRRARWISAGAAHGFGVLAAPAPGAREDFAVIREFLNTPR